jgi:hypothetical protein
MKTCGSSCLRPKRMGRAGARSMHQSKISTLESEDCKVRPIKRIMQYLLRHSFSWWSLDAEMDISYHAGTRYPGLCLIAADPIVTVRL